MERRKFVIGLGALASGAAAATGTGAFSQMTTDGRDASIGVVNDSDGMIALKAGGQTEGEEKVAYENGDGDLVIDVTSINTNSEYLFGEVEVDGGGPADIHDLANVQGDDNGTSWFTTTYDNPGDKFSEGDATVVARDGQGSEQMFDSDVKVSSTEYLFGIYNHSSTERDIWLGIDSRLGNMLGAGDSGVNDRPGNDDRPSWAVVGESVPSGGLVAVGLHVNAGSDVEEINGEIRVSADRQADLDDLPEDDEEADGYDE